MTEATYGTLIDAYRDNSVRAAADRIFFESVIGSRYHPILNAALCKSCSQLSQDVFALCCSGFRDGGYFVEFGAADGVTLSNTLMLEREHAWQGILAEPARGWHEALGRQRSASVDQDCVWSESGSTLKFREAMDGTLSTIASFIGNDRHAGKREAGVEYSVRTVSLIDLLRRHDAPSHIDFVSIDTEGSELAILEAFDFDVYSIRSMCVEHNYGPDRLAIRMLLEQKGYVPVLAQLSKFDDWYIKRSALEASPVFSDAFKSLVL